MKRGKKVLTVEWKGEQRTVSSLAKEYGHADIRIRSRLRKGWTIEEALLTPAWRTYRYKPPE